MSIHKRNLRLFAIEMFKFKRCLAPALCKEMIPQNAQNTICEIIGEISLQKPRELELFGS